MVKKSLFVFYSFFVNFFFPCTTRDFLRSALNLLVRQISALSDSSRRDRISILDDLALSLPQCRGRVW